MRARSLAPRTCTGSGSRSWPAVILLRGFVPVGGAIELAGKVTVSSIELGTKLETSGLLEPVHCPNGSCSFHRKVDGTATLTPTIDGPSLGDLRFEPSLTASATVKLAVGSAVIRDLEWDLVEAKVGAKLAASYALSKVQIFSTPPTSRTSS